MKKTMKLFFLPLFVLSTVTLVGCNSSQQGNANSLMISEVVDGTERKDLAVELYNNTDKEIDLNAYSLCIQFSEEVSSDIRLSGVVKAKDTFVFVHKDAVSDELKAKANGFIFIGLESNNILYNGKQPLALKKGNKRIDLVGTWDSFGIDYATDRTLTRKKEFLFARQFHIFNTVFRITSVCIFAELK